MEDSKIPTSAEESKVIYQGEALATAASNERLKHIHSIKEKEDLKEADEKAVWLISNKNSDFMKTWANIANYSEKVFEELKKGVPFRVEMYFDPEADIAEINIYEKITAKNSVDKNQEYLEEKVIP